MNLLLATPGQIYGGGASALVNSNVTLTSGGSMYCYGDRTCAASFIVGDGSYHMRGHLSGQNSIFKSYNDSASYYFWSTMSGKNGTILCGNNHTCNVFCVGNACQGLNLTCIDGNGTCTFNIDCALADYDEYVCPDGEKLSPFMKDNYLPDLSNVSSGYSDYQTGLNDCQKTGIGQTDFCFGFQDCTERQLRNSSVCCSAARGCYNANSIETEERSNLNFIRCDGYFACVLSSHVDEVRNTFNVSSGIVYISGSFASAWIAVDARGDGYIVCSGEYTCYRDALMNAYNLYCNGYKSCFYATVSDIANVYVY